VPPSAHAKLVPAPLAENSHGVLNSSEEFADDLLLRGSAMMPIIAKSHQRGYRLFICPKPFFKRTRLNNWIVVPSEEC
jgi:hypothetical protein